MRQQIERVNINEISYEDFVNNYLLKEVPVVLTHVDIESALNFSPEDIKSKFADPDKAGLGWFDAPMEDSEYIVVPDLVKKVLSREDMGVREFPMRVFMQPNNHHTLPHYDGNSLHGLNLQVRGRKRWILTSPNTPLPLMPFMFAAMVHKDFTYDEDKYDIWDFEVGPGEMVFLCRYMIHEVRTLEDVNVNFNWVFTPKQPNESSELGKREVEIVKLRKDLPFVNKIFFPDDFTKYGGKGDSMIETYSNGISSSRMYSRFLKELVRFSFLPFYAKDLKSQAERFKKNNFNVD